MQVRATTPYGCNVRVYGAAEKDGEIQVYFSGALVALPVTKGESSKSIAARLQPLLPKVSVTSRKSSNKVACP